MLLSICIFSCKKNCINKDVKADLSGKVKSIKQYNLGITGDTITLYLYYDSITGILNLVKNDTNILCSIKKLDENNIIVYENTAGFTYKINVKGQQIQSIYKLNTIVSSVNYTKDSIHDEGSVYCYNVDYYNILNKYNNYISYSVSYMYNFLGLPVPKQENVRLAYTQYINTSKCMQQDIGTIVAFPDVFTNISNVLYFLRINGYYILQPNKNLIDSLIIDTVSLKYNYIFDKNEVNTMKVTTINGTSVKEYTYY